MGLRLMPLCAGTVFAKTDFSDQRTSLTHRYRAQREVGVEREAPPRTASQKDIIMVDTRTNVMHSNHEASQG